MRADKERVLKQMCTFGGDDTLCAPCTEAEIAPARKRTEGFYSNISGVFRGIYV